MKLLFDTNIYISESLVGGLAEQVIEAVIDARWRVYANPYLLDEIERVLRDKLDFAPRMAFLARQRVRRRCEPVHLSSVRHQVPADVNDSPILSAAVGAGVDYLVTDDRHLLQMNPYHGIRILSMRAFADSLRTEGLLGD